MKARLR